MRGVHPRSAVGVEMEGSAPRRPPAQVLTSNGGEFRMCWCASGFSCELYSHFAVDFGSLLVVGPAPRGQKVYCASGAACWGYIVGVALSAQDQLMALLGREREARVELPHLEVSEGSQTGGID